MNTDRQPTKRKAVRAVRRSISLTLDIDNKVQRLARQERRSANKVLEALIEAGLESKESEKRRFFAAADRFRAATQPAEVEQAKNELARMIFGE